jgi:hypothetical protein
MPDGGVKIMKKKPDSLWTNAPAVSPLMRPPFRQTRPATFPSYNAFLQRFLSRTNVPVQAFPRAVRLNIALPFSPAVGVSGVI